MKYRVIERFRGKYSIEAMCEVFEVSRSGYYAWRRRQQKEAKAIPHNSLAALAMPFPPSAACRFFDLPPVNLQNLQLHLTKNAFASAPTHWCGIALTQIMPWTDDGGAEHVIANQI